MTAASGLVIVDKPSGLTSHDVVARIRRLAGTRRVGHAALVIGNRYNAHLAETDGKVCRFEITVG